MRFEAGRQATRATNRINNHVLRFGHTIGRDQKMADMTARAVIEDMCRGVVPALDGVCPDGLPTDTHSFFSDAYKMYDRACALRTDYSKRALDFVRKTRWPVAGSTDTGKVLLKLLTSVPGVGEVTALTWISIVCDPSRFQHVKQLAAFCGCDPSLKVSAGKVTAHVKRKGNARLHHALKNVAAQLVRKHNEPLGEWGYSISRRHSKGGWARAINAVSRRVAACLWHVQRTGTEFSYEQYRFYLVDQVHDVPIEAMDLGPRYTATLRDAGMTTSQGVANAFKTTLPATKGIGVGCLQKVKVWLDSNRRTDSSLPASSPEDARSKSLANPPVKSS